MQDVPGLLLLNLVSLHAQLWNPAGDRGPIMAAFMADKKDKSFPQLTKTNELMLPRRDIEPCKGRLAAGGHMLILDRATILC